jgi:putative hydrolase of the HAD superfamily
VSTPALLLDFGGVLLLTPFELIRDAERELGVPKGSLPWTGPFDLGADALWKRFLAGELTEREYWATRAAELRPPRDLKTMFRSFYEPVDERRLVRATVAALADDARAAGRRVGILTNDLQAFHGPEWAAQFSVLRAMEVLVDGSVTGVLKPHRRAYELGVEALGVPAGDVVFVDDLAANVEGAVAAGLRAVWFDVTDVADSVRRVRDALGLHGHAGGAARTR